MTRNLLARRERSRSIGFPEGDGNWLKAQIFAAVLEQGNFEAAEPPDSQRVEENAFHLLTILLTL